MFEVSIERTFSAAHAIEMGGEREPVHGHDWQVVVAIEGDALDGDGLLCDFHALEAQVDGILAPFQNGDLNATPPFDEINPTAEHVAHHIAAAVARSLPPRTRLCFVSVTEAPGCRATYRMPPA